MTVEEIFATLQAHIVKGLMTHSQLADFYDFLNLHGYKRCHEYHYLDESCAMRKLSRYYINRFNKLIKEQRVEDPQIIPDSWFNYTREAVDIPTKKNAIKVGVSAWVNWEKETLELYEQMYKELFDLGESESLHILSNMIKDVSCELKKAERHHMKLKDLDFDLMYAVTIQDELHEKYKEKLKEVGEYLC